MIDKNIFAVLRKQSIIIFVRLQYNEGSGAHIIHAVGIDGRNIFRELFFYQFGYKSAKIFPVVPCGLPVRFIHPAVCIR